MFYLFADWVLCMENIFSFPGTLKAIAVVYAKKKLVNEEINAEVSHAMENLPIYKSWS